MNLTNKYTITNMFYTNFNIIKKNISVQPVNTNSYFINQELKIEYAQFCMVFFSVLWVFFVNLQENHKPSTDNRRQQAKKLLPMFFKGKSSYTV